MQLACGYSEAVICAKGTVRLQPVLECAGRDLDMRFAAHNSLGVREGVAKVEGGYCVENDFEWVCQVLVGSIGEPVETFRALVELECSKPISTLPSLSRVLALALRAGWVRLWLECG